MVLPTPRCLGASHSFTSSSDTSITEEGKLAEEGGGEGMEEGKGEGGGNGEGERREEGGRQ